MATTDKTIWVLYANDSQDDLTRLKETFNSDPQSENFRFLAREINHQNIISALSQMPNADIVVLLVSEGFLPFRDEIVKEIGARKPDLLISEVLTQVSSFHYKAVTLPQGNLTPIRDWEEPQQGWEQVVAEIIERTPEPMPAVQIRNWVWMFLAILGLFMLAMAYWIYQNRKIDPPKKQFATIQFQQTQFNLGEKKADQLVSQVIPFTNTGKVSLKISTVKTPWKTESLAYPHTEILPGQSGKIVVTFTSNVLKSTEPLEMMVFANTNPASHLITLDGDLRIEPQVITIVSPLESTHRFSGDNLFVHVSGGEPPYKISLQKNFRTKDSKTLGQAGQTTFNLAPLRSDPGTYQLIVSDNNNRSSSNNITIDPPRVISSTITDPRDRKRYETIKIGSQTWMKSNLGYESSSSWWYKWDRGTFDPMPYGRLYTYQEALSICKGLGTGWRLPTELDWRNLFSALNASNSEYIYKVRTLNIQFGGFRDSQGRFDGLAFGAFFWSQTRVNSNPSQIWIAEFDDTQRNAFLRGEAKTYALSCRCVKD
ncbi:MAG: DUF1573 domain-containing protein [Bacteroidetes bacterium]|nr:DUF1573 domain-containing protein [Bacteroidota bacterium]